LTIECWLNEVEITAFRLLSADAPYPPDDPFASDGGRFCDASIPTLYVAEQPETAVAEYLRWNPELIGLQDVLSLRLFRFTAKINAEEYDLMTAGCGDPFDVPVSWPNPEHADPSVRYRDTRTLARWVFGDQNGAAIRFRSAARPAADSPNHVLFADRWERTSDIEEVERPFVDGSDIVPLQAS